MADVLDDVDVVVGILVGLTDLARREEQQAAGAEPRSYDLQLDLAVPALYVRCAGVPSHVACIATEFALQPDDVADRGVLDRFVDDDRFWVVGVLHRLDFLSLASHPAGGVKPVGDYQRVRGNFAYSAARTGTSK